MFREGHYTGLLKIVPEDGKPAEIELTPSQAMAVIAALGQWRQRRIRGKPKIRSYEPGRGWDFDAYEQYVRGYSPRQIAEAAGCTEAKVEGAIRRVECGRYWA